MAHVVCALCSHAAITSTVTLPGANHPALGANVSNFAGNSRLRLNARGETCAVIDGSYAELASEGAPHSLLIAKPDFTRNLFERLLCALDRDTGRLKTSLQSSWLAYGR